MMSGVVPGGAKKQRKRKLPRFDGRWRAGLRERCTCDTRDFGRGRTWNAAEPLGSGETRRREDALRMVEHGRFVCNQPLRREQRVTAAVGVADRVEDEVVRRKRHRGIE